MKSYINRVEYRSPVGEMILAEFKGELVMADWKYRKMRGTIDKRIQSFLKSEFIDQDSSLLNQVQDELDEYFRGQTKAFDFPIRLVGSEFQKRVWEALKSIEYGESKSYIELSRQVGDEKAIRAVASANGANAISIIIPCHRIIGSNGELVGYAGGLNAKRKLLQLEGALRQTQLEF